MNSSLEAIRKLMEQRYPDCSELRFIMSNERGTGLARDFAHRALGGLLPSFTSYDEYKAQALSKKLGLRKIDRFEELVHLTLFIREKRPGRGEDAGLAAFNLLPAIRYACMFCLERENLKNLKGIREEQERKIDDLFDTIAAFDEYLAGQGLFMPILRERDFGGHVPGDNDFFVNLPLFTPLTQSFFQKVPRERKVVDMPLFAPSFKECSPDYPSSLNLVRQARIGAGLGNRLSLSFNELQGKATLPAHLVKNILDFLKEREDRAQIYVLLLDEALSFYLFETVFKPLGDVVNFSLGLPLGVSSAGLKVREFIEGMGARAGAVDFSRFRASLAAELYSRRNDYAREEGWAIEAAIGFIDSLEKFAEPLGSSFKQVAGLLLGQKQFFLKGERSAPVQVVGLGETTGAPFDRGIICPLNDEVFPSKVYNGPFLNFIHTPQVQNTHFEMEDLALRQFMSFAKSLDIVSVFDEARNMTPSFFFTFLKNEFGESLGKATVKSLSTRSEESMPFIENDAGVRQKILEHSFSFTTLGFILTCPFGFYLAHIEKVPVPGILKDEDSTSQVLGNFVHAFFSRLAEEPAPLKTWQPVFEKVWEDSYDIARLEGSGIFRLALLNQIEALASHEIEEEKLLLFDNASRVSEKNLEAVFGESGQFRLKGRVDACVARDGVQTILDYKYKNCPVFRKGPLAALVSDTKNVDARLQIALYAYLLSRAWAVPVEKIEGCFVYIKEEQAEKRFFKLQREEIDQVQVTMNALSGRLGEILSLPRLEPNYKSSNCRYCAFKPLCKRENFYRKSAR
ncbi:MAG: PD-(D/E)XK nuclease family protein [Syntrophobacteraceae bacterium]